MKKIYLIYLYYLTLLWLQTYKKDSYPQELMHEFYTENKYKQELFKQ
ncbi:hypothetical protein LCALPC37_0281 [Lacticaseibacillus paracasei]|nr:hypothetical protein LCAM36_0055 [Lacticaseibacillus paracasei]EKQ30493.1 hypothetical protein LCALPC37_0281 [Lacticaseibacillus paracasei]GEK39504.1 hypothetical protein LCA02_11940 [Lacticaseibacillus casei]